MKNLIRTFAFIALGIFVITSCNKDENPEPEIPVVTKGAYILNSGGYMANNASVMYYDVSSKKAISNVFQTVNQQKLGDLGQDMIIYGSKMYIGVYMSAVIYVTDLNCKIIKTIKHDKTRSPRAFTAKDGKVYVSYYEGYVGKIDTASFTEQEIAVGKNPEQLKIANGKLYVANSGGMSYPDYDKTVSVIDLASFKEIKKIDVLINPQFVEVDSHGDIYVISMGNYGDIKNTLQRIDTKQDKVSVVEGVIATWMSMGKNDKLYIISAQYKSNVIEYLQYDAAKDVMIGQFITDGTKIKDPYYICADKVSENVYIGSSDYKTNGTMYVMSASGKLIDKFETGMNPIGAYFIHK